MRLLDVREDSFAEEDDSFELFDDDATATASPTATPILPPTMAPATAPPRVSPPAPEMSLAITPLMAPLASRIRPFYRQRHQVNNFVIPPCTSINLYLI